MTTTIPRPVPISMWGKDHWSTFAYLETRAVDHRGVPDNNHMRTDVDRHPFLCAYLGTNKKKYPTKLRDGIDLSDHDDWDCLEDIESVGFIENVGTGVNPVVKFTKVGLKVAANLRAHKSAGKNFAEFTWTGHG